MGRTNTNQIHNNGSQDNRYRMHIQINTFHKIQLKQKLPILNTMFPDRVDQAVYLLMLSINSTKREKIKEEDDVEIIQFKLIYIGQFIYI